jgi:hypothetical protein
MRRVVVLLGLVFTFVQPAYAQADTLCFSGVPGIDACIQGRFLKYWQDNGGLRVFGYPLSAATMEPNRDTGQSYYTQWFERNRFEYHPENNPPYDVLLGRLGADRLVQIGRNWQAEPRANGPQDRCLWFPETGHNVCDQRPGYDGPGQGFATTFEGLSGAPAPLCYNSDSRGCGIAFYGLPLTEPRIETNASGDAVETQWFERARFEWHVQSDGYGIVLFGLLGDEVHGNAPAPGPYPSSVGHVGQRMVQGVTALTLVQKATGQRGRNHSGSIYTPPPGFYLVVVEMVEENIGTMTHDYNRFNYTMKDVDGVQYEQPTGFYPDFEMGSGQLAPGEKIHAVIPFEVRLGAQHLVLNYDFYGSSGSRIQISLD